jgi:hypothetical protein
MKRNLIADSHKILNGWKKYFRYFDCNTLYSDKLLVYADEVNFVGENVNNIKKTTRAPLLDSSKEVVE